MNGVARTSRVIRRAASLLRRAMSAAGRRAAGAHHSARGAVLPEFALGIPLFILFTFAIIMLALYFFVQGAVTKGAENGLQVAKVIDGYERDVRPISTPSTDEKTRYKLALQDILDSAVEMPLETVLVPSTTSTSHPFRLLPWTISYPDGSSETKDAVSILPGQFFSYTRPFPSPTSVQVDHPTCPAGDPVCGLSIQGQRQWDTILRNHPIEVRVVALYQFIVPIPFFNPRIEVVGRAVGFREYANRPSRGHAPTTTTSTGTTTTQTSTTETSTTATTTTETTTTATTTSATTTTGTTSTATTSTATTTVTGTTTTVTGTTTTATSTTATTTSATTTTKTTTTRTTTTATATTTTGTVTTTTVTATSTTGTVTTNTTTTKTTTTKTTTTKTSTTRTKTTTTATTTTRTATTTTATTTRTATTTTATTNTTTTKTSTTATTTTYICGPIICGGNGTLKDPPACCCECDESDDACNNGPNLC